MEGQPCIRHLQVRVSTVLELVASGRSAAEILAEVPALEPEDITQALAFQRALDRRTRAAARRLHGMTVECFEGPPSEAAPRPTTVAERIALTAELTRAAFRASGRELRTRPRVDWPGEVFEIHDANPGRAS